MFHRYRNSHVSVVDKQQLHVDNYVKWNVGVGAASSHVPASVVLQLWSDLDNLVVRLQSSHLSAQVNAFSSVLNVL